jgi:diguanylate cyclase (GGDEF)-like protein
MPFSHVIAVGLGAAEVAEFARQLERTASGVPVDSVTGADELGELALADPGCLLLLPLVTPTGSAVDRLRSLRQRGIVTPALLLVEPEEMRAGLSLADLGAVDLLPRGGYTGFDLQRVLVTLAAGREAASRAQETEAKARAAQETEATLRRRIEELSHQLAMLAVDDELTGLRNERFMLQRVDEAVRTARRYQTPVACLLVGIDEFHLFHERFGPGFADFVLVQMAHRLRRAIRSTDVLSRYGRDEFFILSPFTTTQGALTLAQRLRLAVAGQQVDFQRHSTRPTLSIGVAAFRADMSGASELIQTAAEALAQARERGGQHIEAL